MLDKLTRGLSFSAQDHPSPAKPAGLGDPDKRASERAWAIICPCRRWTLAGEISS